jgi:5'-nucleotidase
MPFRPELQMIFFDVGNVFVSDDPSGCHIYRAIYAYLGGEAWGTPRQMFEMREEHLRRGGNLWTFARELIAPEHFDEFRKRVRGEIFGNWGAVSPPIPGMHDAARTLREKYRLGIIANQPEEVRPLLEERGIARLFDVMAISEELRVDKPDRRIFDWAFEKSGVEPARSMMIGDRLDNDVKPAKALGMQTVWLRMRFAQRGWIPADDFERAYGASLGNFQWCEVDPRTPEETPDHTVTSPAELVALLK